MKKKLLCAIILAVAMVASVGVFGGCRGEYLGGGVPGMDRDLEIRIRRDFADIFAWGGVHIRDALIIDYFGTLSGFTVVEFDRVLGLPGPRPIELGDMIFNSNQASHIIAWKDGEMFNLWQAYAESILSPSDVQYIHQRINQ